MTDSWWELGETYGYNGNQMEVWRLECPFCEERGNFSCVSHYEKKKPNSRKKLNVEVYQCKNCVTPPAGAAQLINRTDAAVSQVLSE